MIISHLRQFIFLKTKKTAGTSVELALSEICGPDDVITWVSDEDETRRLGRRPQNLSIPLPYRRPGWRFRQFLGMPPSRAGTQYYNHMSAKAVRRSMDPDKFDAYRKVTIVRNPWDREVSLYFWTYRKEQERPGFDAFVRRVNFNPEAKNFDLYSIDHQIVADVVLRYERLDADFESFMTLLGVEPAPRLPRAKSRHRGEEARDYRRMYTPETKLIVRRRYSREIDAFGYEF